MQLGGGGVGAGPRNSQSDESSPSSDNAINHCDTQPTASALATDSRSIDLSGKQRRDGD